MLLVLGGSQALSRSMFVRMVPEKSSAEFFAFFAISTKFASIFGPLLFAVLIHMSGSNRLAILALTSFFIIGMVILGRVNIDEGMRHAKALN
jgi:UMF1 family MFS transporter